jgi:hypothetical protein
MTVFWRFCLNRPEMEEPFVDNAVGGSLGKHVGEIPPSSERTCHLRPPLAHKINPPAPESLPWLEQIAATSKLL